MRSERVDRMSGVEGVPVQRLRLVFSVGESLKYVSHLELVRALERMLRRAGFPLAYTRGFHPHPRLVGGVPLPTGCTGDGEVLDLLLKEPVSPKDAARRLKGQLLPGLTLMRVEELPLKAPAFPTLVREVVYRVRLAGLPLEEVRARVDALMAAEHFWMERRGKRYDLRALVREIVVKEEEEGVELELFLLRDERGRIGRPDQVLDALDLSLFVRSIHRSQIVLREEG